LYLALPSIGTLLGGPNISPDPVGSRLRVNRRLQEGFYGGLQSGGTPVEEILDIYIWVPSFWTRRALGNWVWGGGGNLELCYRTVLP